MTSASLRTDVDALLDRMSRAAAALAEVLAREDAALRAIDVAALETTSRDKQLALAELEHCERLRAGACASAGVPADRDGMTALLGRLDATGALGERWGRLLQTLARCRDGNRAAGALLNLNKRRVGEALALLRRACGEHALYGRDGHALERDGGAPLARA
jgi:flagellar biosynthesis/type III secretory pathway chaperone